MGNNVQRTVMIASLLLLYSIGVCLLGTAVPDAYLGAQLQGVNYTAPPPANMVYHIPQAESAVANSVHVPCSPIKEGKPFAAMLPLFDAVIEQVFKHCEYTTTLLSLNLRKADLLFPAHFFW